MNYHSLTKPRSFQSTMPWPILSLGFLAFTVILPPYANPLPSFHAIQTPPPSYVCRLSYKELSLGPGCLVVSKGSSGLGSSVCGERSGLETLLPLGRQEEVSPSLQSWTSSCPR